MLYGNPTRLGLRTKMENQNKSIQIRSLFTIRSVRLSGKLKGQELVNIDKNTKVPFSKSTTILGLQINSQGSNYDKPTTSKKAIGYSRLNRLRRFHKLSLQRKRHLYLALVRPAMIYPTTPLNATNAPIKLQAVQNRALNWITGLERTNAEHLHSLANIPPLNVIFHQQASKTWSTLRQFHPSLYQSLSSSTPQLGRRPATLFKSSRQQAEGNEPPPWFRTTGPEAPVHKNRKSRASLLCCPHKNMRP